MEFVITPPATPAVPIRGQAGRFPVRRIYCIGFNYADHNREMGRRHDIKPVFFAKPADAVVTGEAAAIPYPPATANLHYEVELVVALGKGGANVPVAAAMTLVHGYAVGCDLTRRDLQNDARQSGAPWDMAKGFDRSAPVSEIVPAESFSPADQRIGLKLNGEIKQQARLSDMILDVAGMIAALSRYVELQPGDLIFTGTPEGVGQLSRGDEVHAFVDGLPDLTFSIT